MLRTFRSIQRCLLLGVTLTIVVAPSFAQPKSKEDKPRNMRDRRAAGPRGRDRGHGPGHMLGLASRLFQLGPEDKQPPTEEEEKELLAFAKKNMPRLHEALQRLKQRRPDRYRQKLNEHAPRLRLMKRVYQRSPKLGRILRQHVEREFDIRRSLHALRRERPDSPVYEAALQQIRELVADTVQLEIEALQVLAELYEEHRDERIQARTAQVINDDAELPRLPPKLRNLVGEYHAAKTAPKRLAIRDKIKKLVTERLDSEVEAIQQRAADLEDCAAEEVDARLERLQNAAKKRGPPNRRDRHGRRRRR